jgi:hypothetical protein
MPANIAITGPAMARDFEDLHDIDDLSDDELKALVRQHLASHNGLDVDDLSVRVEDGTIFLGGRVGTEGERRIAEHVVTDVLGIVSVTNEILVDPIRRAESPMDIDERGAHRGAAARRSAAAAGRRSGAARRRPDGRARVRLDGRRRSDRGRRPVDPARESHPRGDERDRCDGAGAGGRSLNGCALRTANCARVWTR